MDNFIELKISFAAHILARCVFCILLMLLSTQASAINPREKNHISLDVKANQEIMICINEKICRSAGFESVPSKFRTDLFLEMCKKISEPLPDRSVEVSKCYMYISGVITALNMESYMAVKAHKTPVFCIEGSADVWITKFIKHVEDNPHLKTKSTDYSFFQLISSQARCDNSDRR